MELNLEEMHSDYSTRKFLDLFVEMKRLIEKGKFKRNTLTQMEFVYELDLVNCGLSKKKEFIKYLIENKVMIPTGEKRKWGSLNLELYKLNEERLFEIFVRSPDGRKIVEFLEFYGTIFTKE